MKLIESKVYLNFFFIFKGIQDEEEAASEQKEKTQDTKKLDCGLAYSDGKCTLGKDVENCIYKTSSDPGIEGCGGLLEIVKVPETYECKQQGGLYKCIKVLFNFLLKICIIF